MAKRVTIMDVAKETGVSIKTVSNVLNNSGNMRPETRARVQEAIDRLGYRINLSARAMKTGGTKLIGLAIADFSQPFMPYLTSSVVSAARARGYAVITDAYQQTGGFEEALPEMSRIAADGWIVFADQPLRDIDALTRQKFPLVVMGDYSTESKLDWVTMPNTQAVQNAVGTLLDGGCRSIALIGGSGLTQGISSVSQLRQTVATTSTQRTLGYCQAFEDRGLKIDWDLVVASNWIASGGRDAVAAIVEQGTVPDAFMCLNDAMAIGAIHELQRRGIAVPADTQVIGFDNVPDGEYAMPALTSIDPHVDEYANHAVSMLIDRIEGYEGEAREYITNFDLVQRGSTR